MTKRRRIGARERLDILERNKRLCHLCNGLIQPEIEAWEVSHDTPLELGGEDGGENLKPAHKKCHRTHTATVDIPLIAKVKRKEARNLGIRKTPARKIVSRGFEKSGRERTPKPKLPPKKMFG